MDTTVYLSPVILWLKLEQFSVATRLNRAKGCIAQGVSIDLNIGVSVLKKEYTQEASLVRNFQVILKALSGPNTTVSGSTN